MWYILAKDRYETTLALSSYRDVAEQMAASFPVPCFLRWSGEFQGKNPDNKYFKEDFQNVQ